MPVVTSPSVVDDSELITSGTAARIPDPPVGPDTVRRWIRTGQLIPVAKTPLGIALLRRSDVERLARARANRRRG